MPGVLSMDLKRISHGIVTVSLVLASGQVMDADRVLAATPSTLPAPILPLPKDIKPPLPRPIPSGFRLSAVDLPDGFVEAKGVQATAFSFGPNANSSAPREAPGFFRAWIRPVNPTKIDLIIAVAEMSNRSDPSMNPSSLRGARVETKMRPGAMVYVATPRQSWDVRWTERGVDVKLIIEAPTVSADQIQRLVAGIKLT